MVYLGTDSDALSALCCVLELLEEVRWPQDANKAWFVISDTYHCFAGLQIRIYCQYDSVYSFHC